MAKPIFVIFTVSPAGFEDFICYYETKAEAEKYILDHKKDPDDYLGIMFEELKQGE